MKFQKCKNFILKKIAVNENRVITTIIKLGIVWHAICISEFWYLNEYRRYIKIANKLKGEWE